MLKINYIPQENKLGIIFDVEMPQKQQDDEHFSSFIQALRKYSNIHEVYKSQNLSGMMVDIEGWLHFSKDYLQEEYYLFHKELIDLLLKNERGVLGEGLEVNFHQKIFDHPERYWSFIFNQENFIDYIFNRIHWILAPRYKAVAPMPLHVDIETANTCNMSCPMCYRDGLKEVGKIDFNLFKKVIDECAQKGVFSVRLSWRGESLTHPQIKDMIGYACSKIPNVSTLTNVFYINDDIIKCMIKNKLSYLAVSFDGIKDNYNMIRYPAKFENSYEKLYRLLEARKQAGTKLPQVRLCTIWPAIKDDPDDYYNTMEPVSDYMVYNPYINFKGEMKIKPDFICQYPWERLVVAFNGKTQCCTGWNADDIILGNALDESLEKMWHSDLLNQLRETHASGRRMDYSSCAECRHGSKGDPDISIIEIVERRY